jgi:hypothetical protein
MKRQRRKARSAHRDGFEVTGGGSSEDHLILGGISFDTG